MKRVNYDPAGIFGKKRFLLQIAVKLGTCYPILLDTWLQVGNFPYRGGGVSTVYHWFVCYTAVFQSPALILVPEQKSMIFLLLCNLMLNWWEFTTCSLKPFGKPLLASLSALICVLQALHKYLNMQSRATVNNLLCVQHIKTIDPFFLFYCWTLWNSCLCCEGK